MNSRTLKPSSHQTVMKATAGMNSGIVRKIERCCPPLNGAMTYCAMPKSLSNIQFQMRKTTETGRM